MLQKIGEAEVEKEKDVDYLSSIEVRKLFCYPGFILQNNSM